MWSPLPSPLVSASRCERPVRILNWPFSFSSGFRLGVSSKSLPILVGFHWSKITPCET